MTPPVPDEITLALERHPEPVQAQLLAIRSLIFTVAQETEDVGELTETLRWGEPSYLTEHPKTGTTIRLGVSKQAPDKAAIFVSCQTSLIEDFRVQFGADFEFEGTRGLILNNPDAISGAPLSLCIESALTYHKRKTTLAKS